MKIMVGTRVAFGLGIAVLVAGCEGQDPFAFLTPSDTETTAEQSAPRDGETRDVEAPEIFGVTDAGLWDGRPSLGGVWVAYPDVQDPERVVIRNTVNGSTVIGALFRRERDNPGPRFQISSDAADALNILAGAPTELEVIALKREVIVPDPEVAPTPEASPETIDPSVIAAAAIEAAELADEGTTETVLAQTAPPAPPPPAASSLERPFIQIGIFNVKDNADATEAQMRAAGLAAETLTQESQGNAFFRVIVGPAQTESARAAALETVKSLGFADAYFVTN